MKDYPVVLIDFSNIVWACWYVRPDDWRHSLRLKLNGLSSELRIPIASFLMIKDQHAKEKYELFPSYKGKRKKPDVDPRPEAEVFVRKEWGSRFVWSPDHEADDAIATVVARLQEADQDVIVVSGDHDLWQLLDPPHVNIFDPIKKLFVTDAMVLKSFEVEDPRHIRAYKALWGDASDNLPNNAPRMQQHLLPIIKKTDGNIVQILSGQDVRSDRCRELLIQNHYKIVLNYRLAGLDTECELAWQ